MRSLARHTLALASILLTAGACLHPVRESVPHREPPPVVSAESDAAESESERIRLDVPRGRRFIAGWSAENRPIHYQVHGQGQTVVLVIAAIHGNEPTGEPLVERLARELDLNPRLLEGRTVVLCPLANPDGLARKTRWNADGVDLNRNYPSVNFRPSRRNGSRPLSEPESRVIAELVQRTAPARVLSIHEPLACIDHDGPGEAIAGAMGRHTHLRPKKLGARPGSLGSWVGETLGIPIITLELPSDASGRSSDDLWWLYGRALLAFIRHPDSVDV
jgi:protein MpaA